MRGGGTKRAVNTLNYTRLTVDDPLADGAERGQSEEPDIEGLRVGPRHERCLL